MAGEKQPLTTEEWQDLYQFLAGYWYDREDDDVAIVQEFVNDVTPELRAKYTQLIRKFVVSPDSIQTKLDFIRKSVWRWFPSDTDAPINWLKEILLLLEGVSTQQGKE